MNKKTMREIWFRDWEPSREENPNGIRDLLTHPVPLMHDESRQYDRLRASLPGTGDDPSVTAYDYHENPWTNKPPSAIRAALKDPDLPREEKKRIFEAIKTQEYWLGKVYKD